VDETKRAAAKAALDAKRAAALKEIKQAKARAKIDKAVKRRCGGG
jgi:hypothetical protein